MAARGRAATYLCVARLKMNGSGAAEIESAPGNMQRKAGPERARHRIGIGRHFPQRDGKAGCAPAPNIDFADCSSRRFDVLLGQRHFDLEGIAPGNAGDKLAGRNDLAFFDRYGCDDAVAIRDKVRVGELVACKINIALGTFDTRFGFCGRRDALIESRLSDVPVIEKLPKPFKRSDRFIAVGLGSGCLCFLGRQRELKVGRIKPGDHITLFHPAADLNQTRGDFSRDSEAKIGLVAGLHRTDVAPGLNRRFEFYGDRLDRLRSRLRWRGRFGFAASQRRRTDKGSGKDAQVGMGYSKPLFSPHIP